MPGSKPPSAANRSARTSMHGAGHREARRGPRRAAPGRARPARRAAPARRSCRPTCRPGAAARVVPRRRASGPTTPALERNASSTRSRTARARGATSSWQEAGRRRRPRRARAPRWRRRRSRGCAVEAADVGRRAGRRATRGIGVGAAGGVEDEHRQVRVVLGGQAGEGVLEPRAGVVGDDDGDDRRRGRARRSTSGRGSVLGVRAMTVDATASASDGPLRRAPQ